MKTSQPIKFIQFCHLTGDFVVITESLVALFSLNGVILGTLNLIEHQQIYQKVGKITCAEIKSLKNTESEIHLFTGHENGDIFMWRLNINKYLFIDENTTRLSGINEPKSTTIILDSYRFAYNRHYYYNFVKRNFDFKLKFDEPFEFNTKKNIPLRLIKLTEDCSMLITIHDDLSLNYWNYSDSLHKKSKNKQSIKTCPQCNSQLGSSKSHCTICKKKICSQCKIEVDFFLIFRKLFQKFH